jgi:hypothetical protein
VQDIVDLVDWVGRRAVQDVIDVSQRDPRGMDFIAEGKFYR